MQTFLPLLEDNLLFAEMESADTDKLLSCASGHVQYFVKGEVVVKAGEPVDRIIIVLAGGAHIIREDFWGARTVIAELKPAEVFGEIFNCLTMDKLPVSVVTAENSEILLLDGQRLLNPCRRDICPCHLQLLCNVRRLMAMKNVVLASRLIHLTRPKVRGKLSSYLSAKAWQTGKRSFSIPCRQALANYLVVDTHTVTNELIKMREEKLLNCRLNKVELLPGENEK